MDDSRQVNIEIRSPKVVQQCLDRMTENMALDENGRVTFPMGFKFYVCSEILSDNVTIKAISHGHTNRAIINKALFRLGTYKRHTLPMFRRALAVEAKRHLRDEATYTVLMLLNSNDTAFRDHRSFDIGGTVLRICTWASLREEFGSQLQRLLDNWRSLEIGDGMSNLVVRYEDNKTLLRYFDFTPALCEVQAYSLREAVGQAELAFDTLRALLNMQQIYGMTQYQGGRSKPLGKLLPSPVLGAFASDKSFQEPLYFTVGRYRYSRHQITPKDVERAAELLSRLTSWQKDGQSTRDMLVDILCKYGQGLDTPDWQSAFLFFWQILEIAALQSQTDIINMRKVIARTYNLITGGKTDLLLKQLLECLKRTRNELVHLGKFPEEGLHQVNLLKSVVDRVIDALLTKLDDLPDRRSLEVYYRCVTLNNAEIETQRRVIDFISQPDNRNL
ncbi:MAG: hypothetical protein H8D78_13420 [Chloroflexi bacterium]|nr:hypothetical protein [Chloroflexota bacterium]